MNEFLKMHQFFSVESVVHSTSFVVHSSQFSREFEVVCWIIQTRRDIAYIQDDAKFIYLNNYVFVPFFISFPNWTSKNTIFILARLLPVF